MRIGIDIRHLTDLNPAGVGGYTINLLHALFGIDKENEYVLFASGTKSTLAGLPKFDYPNVSLVTLPIPNKILNRAIHLTGKPYLEDLISRAPEHKSTRALDIWFFPNLNYISTRLPYVITAHDLSFKIFPEFFSWRMRLWHKLVQPKKLFPEARQIICPSRSTKQDLIELYGIQKDRVVVTPLAVETIGQPRARLDAINPYILSLATIEPRKNQQSVIEAYEIYRDKTGNEVRLIIAGGCGWKSEPVVRAAKRSRYGQDIELKGYVSENEKWNLLNNAKLLLFPSFYEGFGLPVLEAMTAGCPVITAHTGSLPELVQNAAITIDPFNVNDLTVAIQEILNSKQLYARLSVAGRERAKEFSWELTAKKTLKALTERQ